MYAGAVDPYGPPTPAAEISPPVSASEIAPPAAAVGDDTVVLGLATAGSPAARAESSEITELRDDAEPTTPTRRSAARAAQAESGAESGDDAHAEAAATRSTALKRSAASSTGPLRSRAWSAQ